jgi:hypothetical protein
MKAEHRKELETNTLAEGVGQLVRRMKGRPKRNMFGWVAAGVAFLVVLFLVYRGIHMSREDNAERWAALDLGSPRALDGLIVNSPDTYPGKSALLEKSWITFWEEGIKGLAHTGQGAKALKQLEAAARTYEEAAKACKDDPTMEPEALYALAIIEETRAVLDRKHLDSAKTKYEELDQKYGTSAFGGLARERLKLFTDDNKRKALAQFYLDLSEKLRLEQELRINDALKGLGLDEFGKKLKPPVDPD